MSSRCASTETVAGPSMASDHEHRDVGARHSGRPRVRRRDLTAPAPPGQGELRDEGREAADLSPANTHGFLIIKGRGGEPAHGRRDVEDLPRAERPRPAASCPCERVLARHRARAGPDRSRRRRGGTEFQRATAAPSRCTSPASRRAQMSLLTPQGRPSYTQQADSLGGLLFRNVPPGSGLPRARRLRRPRIGADHRALRQRPAPWDPEHLQPVDPRQRLHVPHHP